MERRRDDDHLNVRIRFRNQSPCPVFLEYEDLVCSKPVEAMFCLFAFAARIRHSGSHKGQAHLTCEILASWDCSWDSLRLADLEQNAE
jgi:hypothetical protein